MLEAFITNLGRYNEGYDMDKMPYLRWQNKSENQRGY